MREQLLKAFENYKEAVETVISLYKKGHYTDCAKAFKQIDEYRNQYTNLVGGMLVLKLIDEELHEEAYEWIINYEQPSLFE